MASLLLCACGIRSQNVAHNFTNTMCMCVPLKMTLIFKPKINLTCFCLFPNSPETNCMIYVAVSL